MGVTAAVPQGSPRCPAAAAVRRVSPAGGTLARWNGGTVAQSRPPRWRHGLRASGPAGQCSTGPADPGAGSPAGGSMRPGCIPRHPSGHPSISIKQHVLLSLNSGSHDRRATLDDYGVSPEALMESTSLKTGLHYPGKHISPKARAIYLLGPLFLCIDDFRLSFASSPSKTLSKPTLASMATRLINGGTNILKTDRLKDCVLWRLVRYWINH